MVGVTGIEPVTPSMSTKRCISDLFYQNTDFIIFDKNSTLTNAICVYTMSTTKRNSVEHR